MKLSAHYKGEVLLFNTYLMTQKSKFAAIYLKGLILISDHGPRFVFVQS